MWSAVHPSELTQAAAEAAPSGTRHTHRHAHKYIQLCLFIYLQGCEVLDVLEQAAVGAAAEPAVSCVLKGCLTDPVPLQN